MREQRDLVLEHLLVPEYWDGHSIQDECDWLESHIKDIDHFEKLYEEAGKVQDTFVESFFRFDPVLDAGNYMMLTRFDSGTFDAREHDEGTMVRPNSEWSWDTLDGRKRYLSGGSVGIICLGVIDGKVEKRLVSFSPGKWNLLKKRVETNLSLRQDPIIEIGNVNHIRLRNWPFPKHHFDYITRVNSVDIVAPFGVSSQSSAEASRATQQGLVLAPQLT